MKYKLAITFSGLGTEEEVTKQYSKEGVNRIFDFDTSEFVGTEDEHHSGTFYEIIETDNLKSFMKNYIKENNMYGECFGVYDIEDNENITELLTEDDINI
jgi:hypothetical protein